MLTRSAAPAQIAPTAVSSPIAPGDHDQRHLDAAGTEHFDRFESINVRYPMLAEHDIPGFLPPCRRHPRSVLYSPPTHLYIDIILKRAHGELGSGIGALNDQNRERDARLAARERPFHVELYTDGMPTGRTQLPPSAHLPDHAQLSTAGVSGAILQDRTWPRRNPAFDAPGFSR